MRVLIAEDELLTRRLLMRDLQTFGYEVEAAENGRMAWELFEKDEHRFQLVLTDWNMPEVNGIELIQRIREAELEEYVYLILLTARNEKDDLVEGMEAGADDFIGKPFEKDELRVRLHAGERMLQIQHVLARQKHELETKNAMLENLTEELQRSNAELDEFAYAAWHDLRAPLRTQQTRAGLLEQRWKGKLDEKTDDAIARIMNNVAGMYEILDDLYEHSQVGGLTGNVAAVELLDVFDKARANLQAEIAECQAEVTSNPLPRVTVAESEVIRLFQNLIGNAIKYRGERVPKIHVRAERQGSEWLFSVSDNGIGFESDKKERIFGPGIKSRLHSTKEYPGTGFGLAFCKRVVERHGGRIWAESKPGEGSTFYFTLKADEE